MGARMLNINSSERRLSTINIDDKFNKVQTLTEVPTSMTYKAVVSMLGGDIEFDKESLIRGRILSITEQNGNIHEVHLQKNTDTKTVDIKIFSSI